MPTMLPAKQSGAPVFKERGWANCDSKPSIALFICWQRRCPEIIVQQLSQIDSPSPGKNETSLSDRILAPCNYCHHPWCVGHKSYHKALLIMFCCDGISDHASWNEVFHYWDTKLSCLHLWSRTFVLCIRWIDPKVHSNNINSAQWFLILRQNIHTVLRCLTLKTWCITVTLTEHVLERCFWPDLPLLERLGDYVLEYRQLYMTSPSNIEEIRTASARLFTDSNWLQTHILEW